MNYNVGIFICMWKELSHLAESTQWLCLSTGERSFSSFSKFNFSDSATVPCQSQPTSCLFIHVWLWHFTAAAKQINFIYFFPDIVPKRREQIEFCFFFWLFFHFRNFPLTKLANANENKMWHAAVLRLLRRRIVLALIFCLSLTYFLVNLFGNVSVVDGWPIKNLLPKDIDNILPFIYSQGVSLSKDSDDIVYTRQEPLVWRETSNNSSLNEVTPPQCRNSVQGRTHIVDDEGYVCSRSDLLATGCCKLTALSEQYDCDTCIDDGCCAVYEYCVSCCLNPNKVSWWMTSSMQHWPQ